MKTFINAQDKCFYDCFISTATISFLLFHKGIALGDVKLGKCNDNVFPKCIRTQRIGFNQQSKEGGLKDSDCQKLISITLWCLLKFFTIKQLRGESKI